MLVLPYPVSANRYWRTYQPKGHRVPVTVVSREARDYKAAVERIARENGIWTPLSGRVEVVYRLFPRSEGLAQADSAGSGVLG